ncbi:MAG TPA: undecaprenyl diphosphate synthase family protein [Clostridium sp.]|uniref:undecaprenyl diphosphate synthase family protein n=1 Tax=Clostridium sp. TaxID=1506 RepID=UPI002F91D650
MRIPNHIGIIPDGNRRWSVDNGLSKDKGYTFGLDPGLALYKICKSMGVKEITYYGFTTDNTKRPALQREAFAKACVDAVKLLSTQDADLLVVGNSDSPMFPKELIPYTTRKTFGKGGIKLNFLVNYGWEWDLSNLDQNKSSKRSNIINCIKTNDISKVDLIIRWGGRRRLSGFLPLQSIYSDFYVIDDFWPDFKPEHLLNALNWYNDQDLTLGG